MVQVLPYVPSFGERLAETIGQAGSTLGQAYAQRLQNQQAQKTLGILQDPKATPMQKVSAFMTLPEGLKKSSAPIWAAILGPQAQAQVQDEQLQRFKQSHFGDQSAPMAPEGTNGVVGTSPEMLPNAQQMVSEATPNGSPRVDPNNIQTWPDQALRELSATEGAPGKFAKSELERRETSRKEKTHKETEIFKENEKPLREIGDGLRDLEMEDARLARLENLYSDASKFPPAWMASILSSDGQINPIAASQLSPEAQEAIKLTIDSLSGAQSLFGGKVSNFEAATYLKRNATLLNTAEGRTRILRDLRALNEMKRKYAEGLLDIIDEKGGSDKISITSAERLWRKQHKKELDSLNERFINPESNFKSLPDASKYQGRKVKNDETGEVFISDGSSWKPFKG